VTSFDPMANGKHRSRRPLNYEGWQSMRNGRPHTVQPEASRSRVGCIVDFPEIVIGAGLPVLCSGSLAVQWTNWKVRLL